MGALDTRREATGSAAALASYLLFEAPFVNALLQWGERDALAKKNELLAFFDIDNS